MHHLKDRNSKSGPHGKMGATCMKILETLHITNRSWLYSNRFPDKERRKPVSLNQKGEKNPSNNFHISTKNKITFNKPYKMT
uniref:Uncharacterized protein n=1 Tax=Rhizophora mucronata TaxID=61149 RepID=A0A2P2P5J0_RHIMU